MNIESVNAVVPPHPPEGNHAEETDYGSAKRSSVIPTFRWLFGCSAVLPNTHLRQAAADVMSISCDSPACISENRAEYIFYGSGDSVSG